MADTRGIRAGRAFVELGVSDKLTAGLRRAQKQVEAFGAERIAQGIDITLRRRTLQFHFAQLHVLQHEPLRVEHAAHGRLAAVASSPPRSRDRAGSPCRCSSISANR